MGRTGERLVKKLLFLIFFTCLYFSFIHQQSQLPHLAEGCVESTTTDIPAAKTACSGMAVYLPVVLPVLRR
jgi:hypothetical protein